LREFKNNVWKNIFDNYDDRHRMIQRVFFSFFDYWLQHKKRNLEFEWVINSDYFYTEELWNKYVKKNLKRKTIFLKPEHDKATYLEFLPNKLKEIKKSFLTFYEDVLCFEDVNKDTFKESDKFEMGDSLSGFYTAKEFDAKHQGLLTEEEISDIKGYVPKTKITAIVFSNMTLKCSPHVINIINNRILKTGNFKPNDKDKLMRIKLKIRRQVSFAFKDNKIKGSYKKRCHACGKMLEYKTYEISAPSHKHMFCPKSVDSKGNFKNVTLSKTKTLDGKTLGLYCYEVIIYKDDKLEKFPRYFHSLENDLTSGEYFFDVVTIDGELTSPDDSETRTIMLGKERAVGEIIEIPSTEKKVKY